MGNRKCIGNCEHVSEVYCNGEYGLPIFEQHTVTQGMYVLVLEYKSKTYNVV